jgi:hypothetical protein
MRKKCPHGRQRHFCKECRGSQICPHWKRLNQCPLCNPRSAFNALQKTAEKRGLDFDLTLQQYKMIVAPPCVGCNESKVPRGIDRRDNDKGYLFGNCQPMCDWCNKMKRHYSEEELDQHIRKIIHHRPELAFSSQGTWK